MSPRGHAADGEYVSSFTHALWCAWQAAPAAQPSPGGQGTGVSISDSDRAVLQRLQNALPFTGINGWGKGAEVLERLLRDSLAARQPVGQEPITVEAVAEIFNDPEYGLSIHWLLENGIGELQVGDLLMVADRAITDEDGSGEVYTAPPAQQPVGDAGRRGGHG